MYWATSSGSSLSRIMFMSSFSFSVMAHIPLRFYVSILSEYYKHSNDFEQCKLFQTFKHLFELSIPTLKSNIWYF